MTQASAHKTVFDSLKGALVEALGKIAQEINGSQNGTTEYMRTLTATLDALQYVEELVIELLRSLCRCQPHAPDGRYTINDIEARVNELFHNSIDRWATSEAQSHVAAYKSNRSKKTPLRLPVDRIHPVAKQVFDRRLDYTVSVYLTSVLEFVAADILKMTGNYVKNTRANEIQRQDVKIALSVDKVLMNVLFHDGSEESVYLHQQWSFPAGAPVNSSMDENSASCTSGLIKAPARSVMSYTQSVRRFEVSERQYLRTLQLILKVFREPFYRQFPRSKDIEVIFSAIHDVYELTANITSMLEDVFDGLTDENEPALIGSCIEELAEAQEFDVYVKYAKDILTPVGRDRLSALLQRNDVVQQLCVQNTVNGRAADIAMMRNAAKYLLPKLLLTPLCHFQLYIDTIILLKERGAIEIKDLVNTSGAQRYVSPAASGSGASAASIQQREEDAYILKQCHGILHPITIVIEKQLALLAQPAGSAAQSVAGSSLSGSQSNVSLSSDALSLSVAGEIDSATIDNRPDTHADTQSQASAPASIGSVPASVAGSTSTGVSSGGSSVNGVRRVSAYQFWYANQHLLNASSGSAVRRLAAVDKLEELHRVVENWDRAAMSARTVNEFLIEGCLSKWTSRSKQSERYAFLFDSVLLLCKFASSSKRSSLASQSVAASTPAFPYACVGVLPNAAAAVRDYKFKERVPLNRIEVIDREDLAISAAERESDTASMLQRGGSVCFELHYYDAASSSSSTGARQSITLCAKSMEEKQIWLAELVGLQTMSMLDRLLDAKLKEEEKLVPLPLPSDTRLYRFAEKDTENVNIVFEENVENSGGEAKALRGASLLKLVERLAFPSCVDLKFARTFLITYRDFCTPMQLLDLLIERFSIPEPDLRPLDAPSTVSSLANATSTPAGLAVSSFFGSSNSIASTASTFSASSIANDTSAASSLSALAAKRFRQEYAKPIKMRVLNVIKQWVEYHYYDFDDDPSLLRRLDVFLRDCCESGASRYTRKGIESVRRKMREQQALYAGGGSARRSIHFDRPPPPIEWHIVRPPTASSTSPTLSVAAALSAYSPRECLMVLHPIEIARQSTLLEFETFREIKPNELIGLAWTKPSKHERSPNLLRITSYSNRFTYFLQQSIVETENLEERCAVLSRIIDILQVFVELNNFSGIMQVISALDSSAVHRLEHTFDALSRSPRHAKVLNECRELPQDHYRKYVEKLRMIDPPCVPFLGYYLTNLIHIEEGNPDYLRVPNSRVGASAQSQSLSVPYAAGRRSPAVEASDESSAADETSNPSPSPSPSPTSASNSTSAPSSGSERKDEYRLINFSKRRKLADIISEIKQCQQKPYCLLVEQNIRRFLEELNPFGSLSENDFQSALYSKSLEIEPRGSKQLPRFPTKFKSALLKSPGVKPTASSSSANSTQSLAAPIASRGAGAGTSATLGAGAVPATSSNSLAGSHTLLGHLHSRSQSQTSAALNTAPRSVSPPSAYAATVDNLSLVSASPLSTSKSRSTSNTNVSGASFGLLDSHLHLSDVEDSRRIAEDTASLSSFSFTNVPMGYGTQPMLPSGLAHVNSGNMRRNPSVNASSVTLASVALDDAASIAATNLSSATSTSTIASLQSTAMSINANASAMYNPIRTRNISAQNAPIGGLSIDPQMQGAGLPAGQAAAGPLAEVSLNEDVTRAVGRKHTDPSSGGSSRHVSTRLLHGHSLSDSSMVCDAPPFAIPTPSSLSSGSQTPDKSMRPAATAGAAGSHQHLAPGAKLMQSSLSHLYVAGASNSYPFPSPSASLGSQLGSAHSSSTGDVAPPLPPRRCRPQRGDSHSSSGTSNSSNVPSAVSSPIAVQHEASFFPSVAPIVPPSAAGAPALPPRLATLRNAYGTQSCELEDPPLTPPHLPPKPKAKVRPLAERTDSSSKSSLCDSPPVFVRRASLQVNADVTAGDRAPPLPSRGQTAVGGGSRLSAANSPAFTSSRPHSHAVVAVDIACRNSATSPSQLPELDEQLSSSPVGGGFINVDPFANCPSAADSSQMLDQQSQMQLQLQLQPQLPTEQAGRPDGSESSAAQEQVPPLPPKTYKKRAVTPQDP